MRLIIESTTIPSPAWIDGSAGPALGRAGRNPADVARKAVRASRGDIRTPASRTEKLEAATSAVAAPAGPRPVEREALSYEDLEQLVREQVEANRGRVRPSPAQAAIDAAASAALEEGEIHLASGLLLLTAHRVAETDPLANRVLMQAAIDAGIRFGPRRLRN